jgi:hypothetical protein
MAYMRKMALLPMESLKLNPVAPKPKPYARAVQTQSDEITQILADESLDLATQAALLQQATRKFLHYQRSRPTDYPATTTTTTSTNPLLTKSTSITPSNTPVKLSKEAFYKAMMDRETDTDDDDDDDVMPEPKPKPKAKARPQIVRSKEATSGKIVPGRPSNRQSRSRQSILRVWEGYKK